MWVRAQLAQCVVICFFFFFPSLASGDDRVAWYKIHLAECLKHFKSAADLNRAVARAQVGSAEISKNVLEVSGLLENRCLRDMIDRRRMIALYCR